MKRPLRLALLTSVGVLAMCGCSSMVGGVVDDAIGQAKARLVEEFHDIVHKAAENRPEPVMPEPGAPWIEYAVYGLTVLGGSVLVLVDRRWFHNRVARRT